MVPTGLPNAAMTQSFRVFVSAKKNSVKVDTSDSVICIVMKKKIGFGSLCSTLDSVFRFTVISFHGLFVPSTKSYFVVV